MNIAGATELSLISMEESSTKDVLGSLAKHENDTEWSKKTTHFAISYLKKFESEYKIVSKGFLSKELLFDIILPSHGHMEDLATGIILFPENVTLKEALEYYKKPNPKYTKDCSDWVLFLKDQIKQSGFTSAIIIESVDGKIRHIDGLHRMMALGLLLGEDYQYEPIPAYLLIR